MAVKYSSEFEKRCVEDKAFAEAHFVEGIGKKIDCYTDGVDYTYPDAVENFRRVLRGGECYHVTYENSGLTGAVCTACGRRGQHTDRGMCW